VIPCSAQSEKASCDRARLAHSRFRNRGQGARRRSMSKSFLAAAAERTAEAESDLAELQRGTWATDRVG